MFDLRGAAAIIAAAIVLALAPLSGARANSARVLFNFTGSNGANPQAGLIMDADGNLYGTTVNGGTDSEGVVFKLSPRGKETVLHNFTFASDGTHPAAALVRDANGNFLGTTFGGGVSADGSVFKLTPRGRETLLHSFSGQDGSVPQSALIVDASGNLYGTTPEGGASTHGVVFKVSPQGRETVLYSFTGGTDGGSPKAGLLRDASGNLYGTAHTSIGAGGVVFKLSPRGKETVLYTFTGGADGADPEAGLIMDANANLYGTTSGGGGSDAGTVFKLSPRGRETVLYRFSGGDDGANPQSALVMDASGNLYGTTTAGGADNAGVVFKLSPRGRETVLYSFTGGNDGADPQGGLIMDASGNLYGTTVRGGTGGKGVVFMVHNRAQPASP